MNSICRKSRIYPVSRLKVDDKTVSWSIDWPAYEPKNFTVESLKTCSWADPDIEDSTFRPNWNVFDGDINRRSYDKNQPITYDVVGGYPLNPRGRTGLYGRGRLGRWGPNHAADAVVTRWKKSSDGTKLNRRTDQPILEFLAIMRRDCKKWAIPGGFVDAHEEPCTAAVRELYEEAVNVDTHKISDETKAEIEQFFSNGLQVYKGYVDDPRNTDNAWIETTAFNFHDESGDVTEKLILQGRDDAMDVKWIEIEEDMKIYEAHCDIIKFVHELYVPSA